MIRKYDPAFIKGVKKLDIRIRKSFKQKIALFAQNPNNPELNNHPLKREYLGYRSIDITADYRAIFKEIPRDEAITYYFFLIGTHKQLYKKTSKQKN